MCELAACSNCRYDDKSCPTCGSQWELDAKGSFSRAALTLKVQEPLGRKGDDRSNGLCSIALTQLGVHYYNGAWVDQDFHRAVRLRAVAQRLPHTRSRPAFRAAAAGSAPVIRDPPP